MSRRIAKSRQNGTQPRKQSLQALLQDAAWIDFESRDMDDAALDDALEYLNGMRAVWVSAGLYGEQMQECHRTGATLFSVYRSGLATKIAVKTTSRAEAAKLRMFLV